MKKLFTAFALSLLVGCVSSNEKARVPASIAPTGPLLKADYLHFQSAITKAFNAGGDKFSLIKHKSTGYTWLDPQNSEIAHHYITLETTSLANRSTLGVRCAVEDAPAQSAVKLFNCVIEGNPEQPIPDAFVKYEDLN